jgi:hypothetical protein
MEIKVRAAAVGAYADVIQPPAEAGGEPTVVSSTAIATGDELTLRVPSATDPTQIEIGDVVETPAAPVEDGGTPAEPEAPVDPPAPEGGGGEPPAPDPQPDPPAPEGDAELPAGLAVGRVVTLRSVESGVDLPAVVTATTETLDQAAIEAGKVPELTSPKRVHLTVFSPFLADEDRGGAFQAFNVPQFVAPTGDGSATEIVAGTWRFPERV